MKMRARILVAGVVQGVYYRYNTKKKADELSLTGMVRNRADGSVEVVCEGEEDDISRLVEWCRKGPRGALVERVDVTWGEYTGEFVDFSIDYHSL